MSNLSETAKITILILLDLGILIGGLGVVFLRRIIYSGLLLGFVFICIALFYLLSNADFLAAAQVLIYVGAVNVLIVFAIMLVNKPEFQITLFSWTLGDVMALVICTSLFALLTTISLTTSFSLPYTKESLQDISINKEIIPKSVETIGIHLLTDFLVPFEVLSLLLLIALIGAIGIARQEAPIESKNMSISKIKDNQSLP